MISTFEIRMSVGRMKKGQLYSIFQYEASTLGAELSCQIYTATIVCCVFFWRAFRILKGRNRDFACKPVVGAKCLLTIFAVAERSSCIVNRRKCQSVLQRMAVARPRKFHLDAAERINRLGLTAPVFLGRWLRWRRAIQ